MMTTIENFYKENANLTELIKNESPNELLNSFQSYFDEISVIPEVKNDETLKGRSRYVSQRTADILVAFLNVLGESHTKEVLSFVAEQEFHLHHKIYEAFNLVEFMINHIQTIDEMKNQAVFDLLYSALNAFNSGDVQLYGKKAYISNGNHGVGYGGFQNDFLHNLIVKDEIGFHFRLKVDIVAYKLIELGRHLGVSEDVMSRLEELDKEAHLSGSNRPGNPIQYSRSVISHSLETEFTAAFQDFINELQPIIQNNYPNVQVHSFEMFKKRQDVTTDFSISVETFVPIKDVKHRDNFTPLRNTLVHTVKTFNELEETYFGFDFMKDSMAELRKSFNRQPLFS